MKTLLLISFFSFGTAVFAQDIVSNTIDQGILDLVETIAEAEKRVNKKRSLKRTIAVTKEDNTKKYAALKRVVKFIPKEDEAKG